MIVVLKEPHRYPTITGIPNKLEALQKQVGGYIQTVGLMERSDIVLICNEEGKFNNLEENVALVDKDGVIVDKVVGPVIIAGVKGDEFTDLNAEQVHFALQWIDKRSL